MKNSSYLIKYLRYLLLISNLFLVIETHGENIKVSKDKSLQWKTVEKDYYKNQQKDLIWEVVPKEEIFIESLDKLENPFKNTLKNTLKKTNKTNLYQISPIIPLNNFINENNLETEVEWKSSFEGGKSGGIGQQNNSLKIDYGLTDFTQLTGYFSEADDDTYNYIKGNRAQYSLQTFALSLKKKLWTSQNSSSTISIIPTVEYLRLSSGSKETKSIYNESNNLFDKDKFNKIIYSFSLPYSKKINEKLTYTFVPGFIFLPERLGSRTTRNNFYGNNLYIGNGVTYSFLDDVKIIGSLTSPLGPGNNHFDKDLNFSKKSIYSFGLNWDINNKIGIETKITNGFGSSPSTGILTLPSANLPLYAANIKYRPYGKDTHIRPLNKRDKLISFGGITVNNALIPKNGTSQLNLNIDSKGNYFTSYGYSLSNIFQLELLNIGSINKAKNNIHISKQFTDTFLDENNFDIRIGGKFLLFSPQKNDILWTSFRTSVGRNESTNQGYILSELINTYRINNWIAANLSSKYFISGIQKFGGFGTSMYLNMSDNLQIIPEINYLFDKNLKSNYTFSIRYSINEKKSIDLYTSNAIGTKDLGQLLRSEENRVGIKFNWLY